MKAPDARKSAIENSRKKFIAAKKVRDAAIKKARAAWFHWQNIRKLAGLTHSLDLVKD
jgi:hypothetical protein